MSSVQDFCRFLETVAPLRLAEDWDNVGLLLGNRDAPVKRVMTCLTVTPSSVEEACKASADLIVTHHPLPFRPLKKITSDTVTGGMVLELIAHRIAVYSPHTAFDSAGQGINQYIAEGLQLNDIQPLQPIEDDVDQLGAGRIGRLSKECPLATWVDRTKDFFGIDGLHVVGQSDDKVQKVAVACGSAGQFLQPAIRAGCDCLITGETNFHTCLEAEARRVSLLLTGHFASERFAVERLASRLQDEFPDVDAWASRKERDPLIWR